MKSVIAAAAMVALVAGTACAQSKGGKLPWAKGTPKEVLEQANEDGKVAFLYFTSKG